MSKEVTASAADNNENITVTNFREVILPGVSALSIRGKGFAAKYKKKSSGVVELFYHNINFMLSSSAENTDQVQEQVDEIEVQG